MKIKVYETLPQEAKIIRTRVFMSEQGFKDEFDDIDKISMHFVLYDDDDDDDIPAATCRVYYSDKKKSYVIGRIAVEKEYRGKNYGTEIIRYAEIKIIKKGGKQTILSAQCRASEFYRKLGYCEYGESYLVEGCPHIWMRKELMENDNA